jgi:hypothetical protein
MNAKQMIRVAVLGGPQAEQWLLVPALEATRKRSRAYAYELVADPASRRPDVYVIDPDHEIALMRWSALDAQGKTPAAFFRRLHPRAKCAILVEGPITSGGVVEALDRLARRFLQVSDANGFEPLAVAREAALAAA